MDHRTHHIRQTKIIMHLEIPVQTTSTVKCQLLDRSVENISSTKNKLCMHSGTQPNHTEWHSP